MYYIDSTEEVEYWLDSDHDIEQDMAIGQESDIPLSQGDAQEGSDHDPLIWWMVAFVSLFQTFHSISDRAIGWLLGFLSVLLKLLAGTHHT